MWDLFISPGFPWLPVICQRLPVTLGALGLSGARIASREKEMERRRDLICMDTGPGQYAHMAVSECNI